MTFISDEILMAYSDKEIDAQTLDEIEEALSLDPQLQIKLQIYEFTANNFANFFDFVLDKPIDKQLIETIESYHLRDRKVQFDNKTFRAVSNHYLLNHSWMSKWTIQLAACFVIGSIVIIGLAVTTNQFPIQSSHKGFVAVDNKQLVAIGDLATILDTQKSGTKSTLLYEAGSSATIIPILSFRNENSHYCREYEIETHNNRRIGGVACRVSNKSWQILVHVELDQKTSSSKNYRTASGRKMAPLDAVVDHVMSGDALDIFEEEKLINSNWKE